MIRNKDKKLVPLHVNPVQENYLDKLTETYEGFDWRNGIYTLRGVREDVLKARQLGMSTIWLALYFLDTINNPLTQTLLVAQDADSTEMLFQVVHRFHASLVPDKQRPTKYSSRREIRFADIDSVIYVGTANATNLGRSQTINNCHLSEFAFYANAYELLTGLLESIPQDGNLTRETTANGMNDYYTERQLIENGESKYVPRFFGWNYDPKYRLAVPNGFTRTEDEVKLAAAYNLDDEQLVWRRDKMLTQKGKFTQEYPINAAEAFLTSGNPYFDREKLKEILDRLKGDEFKPIPAAGIVIPTRFDFNKKADGFELKPLLSPHLNSGDPSILSNLLIWDLPKEGRLYLISADTAEGIDDRGDHDYDSADVWDAETWQQVAQLHGRFDPTEYGLMLAALGWWYNQALVGVERNNHGHTVLSALLHIAKYPLMTQTPSRLGGIYEHQEYDENLKPTAMRMGWPTTPKSKPVALDGLAISTVNGDMKYRSTRTITQMMSFVKLPNGKSGPESGHDDCVSSAAVGDVLLKMRPISRPRLAPLDLNIAPTTPEEHAEADAQAREAAAHAALPPEIAEHLARLADRFRLG